MTIKWLEIRDRGTTIPALALYISADDGWLAERAGYGLRGCILLIDLTVSRAQHDPYEWEHRFGRTMHCAHVWIEQHWAEIQDRQVIDVEYILGERATPKVSEACA